jgi:hypothetical protein
MPVLQIEIGDNGEVPTLPEPLQKHFDAKFAEAFGKGAEKAAREAKTQLEAQIAEMKRGGLGAAEREKLRTYEADLSKAKEELARAQGDAAEAERIRDERHQRDLKDRDARVSEAQKGTEKAVARVRELLGKDIRAAAMAAGARQESLAELELLLGGRIGLDEALQAFVKDATEPSKPALDKDGKPISVEGLVATYLAEHPHHKAAPAGRGGGALGGRSLSGQVPAGDALGSAVAAASVDPSHTNITRAFGEINRKIGAA